MTTARALLRRLLRHGRLDPRVSTEDVTDQAAPEERLDAARQRLKQRIPPPDEAGSASVEAAGQAIPPQEAEPPAEGPPK